MELQDLGIIVILVVAPIGLASIVAMTYQVWLLLTEKWKWRQGPAIAITAVACAIAFLLSGWIFFDVFWIAKWLLGRIRRRNRGDLGPRGALPMH
jgi:hypothetical protein